jgi:enoyl-CoA hydratase
MPRVAAAMLRHRLGPAAYQRAVALAESFDPDAALEAGFFDELVDPAELADRAASCAARFSELDMRAHAASKRRIRAPLLRKLRLSVPLDLFSAVLMGVRGARPR